VRNDKGEGKDNSRSPSGMTTRKARSTAKARATARAMTKATAMTKAKSNDKGKKQIPYGMTTRKITAQQLATPTAI
jgi:hypothetical protein